jgi:ribosomal protein S17
VSIIESKPISKLKKWKVIANTGVKSWFKCSLNFL